MKPEFATSRRRLEHIVTLCWSEVLGRSDIGTDDNFFDVGGTSLHAIKLHLLLQQRLNAEVPILGLFQSPTIRGFVETYVDAREVERRPSPLTAPGARVQAAMTTALSTAERAARQWEAFQSRRNRSGSGQ
jgi:phosphopantetheine binding protein